MASTRRCGHCGTRGHSKRTCEDLIERIERLRSQYGDSFYEVRQYDAKKQSALKRTCSWCGFEDHTRRTCDLFKSAQEDVRKAFATYRAAWIERACETGWVPGALTQRVEGLDSLGELLIVVDVDWIEVLPTQKMHGVYLTRRPERLQANWSPRDLIGQGVNSYYEFELRVPGSVEKFRRSIPSDFIDGTLGLKEFFKACKKDWQFKPAYWDEFMENHLEDLELAQP